MIESRPWLPFAALLLLAALFSLVAAYERDWWVFSKAPQSYRPSYKFDPVTGRDVLWKQ